MVKSKSPSMSLKGYDFMEWLKGNWPTLKELLKVAIPAIAGWTITHNPALTGIVTVGGKFLLDLGHYYFKER